MGEGSAAGEKARSPLGGLDLLFVVLVTAAALLRLPVVFGVEPGVVPAWAAGG